VYHDPEVEAGPVEAGAGDDAVVALGIHFAFELLDLGDDLVAAVDARVGDVPHAHGQRIGAVDAVDEESARSASVLSVIGQHVEFGLFVGGPFVPLHGPVAVVEQGVEVQFELLGRLKPRAAGGRIFRREVQVAARDHQTSGKDEDCEFQGFHSLSDHCLRH